MLAQVDQRSTAAANKLTVPPFDMRDGRPLGAPVCVALKTHPTKVEAGKVFIEI